MNTQLFFSIFPGVFQGCVSGVRQIHYKGGDTQLLMYHLYKQISHKASQQLQNQIFSNIPPAPNSPAPNLPAQPSNPANPNAPIHHHNCNRSIGQSARRQNDARNTGSVAAQGEEDNQRSLGQASRCQNEAQQAYRAQRNLAQQRCFNNAQSLNLNPNSENSDSDDPNPNRQPGLRHPDFEGARAIGQVGNVIVQHLGDLNVTCTYCGALHWIDERLKKSSTRSPKFGSCCSTGKIDIFPMSKPPEALLGLFNCTH